MSYPVPLCNGTGQDWIWQDIPVSLSSFQKKLSCTVPIFSMLLNEDLFLTVLLFLHQNALKETVRIILVGSIGRIDWQYFSNIAKIG